MKKMSVQNRTVIAFERQDSVIALRENNSPSFERNNNVVINCDFREQQQTTSPPKRVFFRRRIPSEILDDLPESSVDPLPQDFSPAGSGFGGGFDTYGAGRLSQDKRLPDAKYGGRAITVIGSPLRRPPTNRSKSVDFSRRYFGNQLHKGYVDKTATSATRSLVCQECSIGTIFGLYHTPTTRRKVIEAQTFDSFPNESRWERTSLPQQSTFSSQPPIPPVRQSPLGQPPKTFHYTPELRYKPVYFGDPRLRRYSCGYSERRPSREISISGLQDFCRTMLTVKTPESDSLQKNGSQFEESHLNNKKNEDSRTSVNERENSQNAQDIQTQKSAKQSTPLRSPKLVKEVLKRMSSHPSGRDPQIPETFSDEDDPDFSVEREAMKVIADFDKSLPDVHANEQVERYPTVKQAPALQQITETPSKDHGLQSDNLVEEVLLSERKYSKHLPIGSSGFGEKFQGRDEIEDSRRFMSLTNDYKSRGASTKGESSAPPKPPRNYDSLPRGFKASDAETQYDVVSSGIHPLTNGHSTANRTANHSNPSPQQNYFVVVAIDFGTTYSGYAFSFTQDPENIHMMRKWEGGDNGVFNQKTPTTLLLDPKEKFHSFGYAARDYYHDLDSDEARQWLYFEKFKMTLHKTEYLSRDTLIYAANGRGLSAMTVFAHALRYFKEHALQELSDQSATTILNDDVRWVVTVPAIWRQPAKQFMRNAAYEAGIASSENPEQLLIALEPEAASIFCRRLQQHQLVPLVSSPQRLSLPNIKEPAEGSLEPAVIENAGTRYMVVDCGGGTVDITVHEIIDENGTIKELHKATGGPYGSVGIDMEFEKLLVDIFGGDFIEHFKLKNPAAFVELMALFEARKRNASPFKITPINMALPYSFVNNYKKTKNTTMDAALKKYGHKDIKWSSQGMLRMEPSVMMGLFQPTLDAIRRHVAQVLDTCDSSGDISYLFLVGGFAESAILQKTIRDAFSDRLKVIIPQGVSLAILKGAVLFGIDPTVVSSRRSRLTYGVGVLNRFINGVHPPEKLVVKDGVEWCADVFDKFVLADQSVCVGDTVIRRYTPARSGQACSVIHIYCSERDDVAFITDPGVKRCGTLVLDLPDDSHSGDSVPAGKREIQTIMIFGDTELKVSAMDVLTGKCVKAEVDFLNG